MKNYRIGSRIVFKKKEEVDCQFNILQMCTVNDTKQIQLERSSINT